MSQRKRLSKTRVHAVQDEEEEVSFTPTSTQVQKGLEKLTKAQVDQKVSELVQYFLVKDQKKLPVRRADIVKNVLKEYRNVYPEIMKRAASTIEQVFGFKVVEIDAKNHVYILVNKLEPAENTPPLLSPGNPKMGLLFIILSIVFMKGGGVREAVIWNTLKRLRVDPMERHEEFGDVKKLITDEFVRQRYLEYLRIPHTEPVEHEFHWGQRAEAEVSKRKILEVVGQLHGQDPQRWSQQYREATSATPGGRSQANTSSQRGSSQTNTSSQRGSSQTNTSSQRGSSQ